MFQLAYEELADNYIASKLSPPSVQELAADQFGIVTLESLAASSTKTYERAPGSGYDEDELEFDIVSYSCSEKGAVEKIDDSEARRFRNFLMAQEVATKRLIHKLLTARDRRVINAILDVSYYTGNSALNQAVSAAWNVKSTLIVDDVWAAKIKFRNNTSMEPNAMVMNWETFGWIQQNTQVSSKISSSGAGRPETARDITTEMLKAVFEIDHIIVSKTMHNTASASASAVMADVWPNHVMLTRVAETEDITHEPCISRTLVWNQDSITGEVEATIGGWVETYRDENIRCEKVRARHQTDEKVFYKDLAVLIPSVFG